MFFLVLWTVTYEQLKVPCRERGNRISGQLTVSATVMVKHTYPCTPSVCTEGTLIHPFPSGDHPNPVQLVPPALCLGSVREAQMGLLLVQPLINQMTSYLLWSYPVWSSKSRITGIRMLIWGGGKGGGRNGKCRLSLVHRNDQLCWAGTRKTQLRMLNSCGPALLLLSEGWGRIGVYLSSLSSVVFIW